MLDCHLITNKSSEVVPTEDMSNVRDDFLDALGLDKSIVGYEVCATCANCSDNINNTVFAYDSHENTFTIYIHKSIHMQTYRKQRVAIVHCAYSYSHECCIFLL